MHETKNAAEGSSFAMSGGTVGMVHVVSVIDVACSMLHVVCCMLCVVCHVMSCHVISYHVMSCHVMSWLCQCMLHVARAPCFALMLFSGVSCRVVVHVLYPSTHAHVAASYVERMETEKTTRAILILKEGITPFAKKVRHMGQQRADREEQRMRSSHTCITLCVISL